MAVVRNRPFTRLPPTVMDHLSAGHGDQFGELWSPDMRVIWIGFCPLKSMMKICEGPERVEAKAMYRPSGDQQGAVSSPRELVTWRSSLPSGRIVQIS